MNAYNVLFVWGSKVSTIMPIPGKNSDIYAIAANPEEKQEKLCHSIRYICVHCCQNGIHCIKTINTKDFLPKHESIEKILADPSTTEFNGNVNGFQLQTTASNSFRTFYPNGKKDAWGNPDYIGFDADILRAFAQNMNFTFRWRRPEPIATWGSQLPNGSWNGIVGKYRTQRNRIHKNNKHSKNSR